MKIIAKVFNTSEKQPLDQKLRSLRKTMRGPVEIIVPMDTKHHIKKDHW